MKDKTINTDFLIMSNTELLNEPLLVAQSTQGRHKPTIPITALSHIVSSRTVDVKFGPLEDVHHPFGTLRLEFIAWRFDILNADIVERLQAVPPAELEIGFDVEVRISVLLVDATAFSDDLVDFCAAHSRCIIVGGLSCRRGPLLRVAPGDSLGIRVLGYDRRGCCR